MNVYLLQDTVVAPSGWVISNVRRGPLAFLDILAFIMRGDTNIDGNLSGIIILDHFNYWQISSPSLEAIF